MAARFRFNGQRLFRQPVPLFVQPFRIQIDPYKHEIGFSPVKRRLPGTPFPGVLKQMRVSGFREGHIPLGTDQAVLPTLKEGVHVSFGQSRSLMPWKSNRTDAGVGGRRLRGCGRVRGARAASRTAALGSFG